MYEVRYKKSVAKDFKKIGKAEAKKILKAIHTKLVNDPSGVGIPLKGKHGVIWRFRVGTYRVLYSFNKQELWILVIHVAYRKEVYD